MILFATFLIVFILGPLTFRRLTRPAPSPRAMRAVLIWVLAALLTALALRFGIANEWGSTQWLTGTVAAALWLAWIGVIALVVLALRRADPRLSMQRWSAALGAAGTTVPWFGLALADLLRAP